MFSSHSSKPMVNECGLSDTSPGNDSDNAHIFVCPSTIQKRDILLSPKNVASCNGQSGYGNFLRGKSCLRLTSFDKQSARGRFLSSLTLDSKFPVESICYRRDGLQKFGRVLKSPRRIFLKESLKQNNHRLRDTLELFER